MQKEMILSCAPIYQIKTFGHCIFSFIMYQKEKATAGYRKGCKQRIPKKCQ
jgi:hypothetical protein